MAFSTFIILLIGHSDLGLVMKSMKENELGAASAGVNIAKYKIFGFILSAGFMALAGVMYVHTLGVIGPVLLTVTTSFMPIIMTYAGGGGTLTGALIGAYLVSFINEYFLVVPALRILIYAIILILILRFFPAGILGLFSAIRKT
jgi:branched-chain amino acid transport system permease protein